MSNFIQQACSDIQQAYSGYISDCQKLHKQYKDPTKNVDQNLVKSVAFKTLGAACFAGAATTFTAFVLPATTGLGFITGLGMTALFGVLGLDFANTGHHYIHPSCKNLTQSTVDQSDLVVEEGKAALKRPISSLEGKANIEFHRFIFAANKTILVKSLAKHFHLFMVKNDGYSPIDDMCKNLRHLFA